MRWLSSIVIFLFLLLGALSAQDTRLKHLGTIKNGTEVGSLHFVRETFGDPSHGGGGGSNLPYRFAVDEDNGLLLVEDFGSGQYLVKLFDLKTLKFIRSFPIETGGYLEYNIYPVYEFFGKHIIVQVWNERLFATDLYGKIVKEFDFFKREETDIQFKVLNDYLYIYNSNKRLDKFDMDLVNQRLNQDDQKYERERKEYNRISLMDLEGGFIRLFTFKLGSSITRQYYEDPSNEREKVFGIPPLDVNFNSPDDDAFTYIAPSGYVYIMRTRPSGIDFYRYTPPYIRRQLQAEGKLGPDAPSTMPKIVSLRSTPWLGEPNDPDRYHPIYAFDGRSETGYLEQGAATSGIYLEITLDRPWAIDKIRVQPGWFDSKFWKQNNRIRAGTVYLDNSTRGVFYTFADSMTAQDIVLPRGTKATVIRIEIDAVYPTTKWDDTGMTEIELWAGGKKLEWDLSNFVEYLNR